MSKLTDDIIRGTCSVHRVDGGMDGSENLAVQITPKGQEFPTTIDLELDDFPVGAPMKDVLNKPAEVEFFIQGVLFKLVVSYMDYGRVACRIHETFTENVKSGVGVIQKPFCTFITVPARRTTANGDETESKCVSPGMIGVIITGRWHNRHGESGLYSPKLCSSMDAAKQLLFDDLRNKLSSIDALRGDGGIDYDNVFTINGDGKDIYPTIDKVRDEIMNMNGDHIDFSINVDDDHTWSEWEINVETCVK